MTKKTISDLLGYSSLLVALSALFGSLYFSEVLHFPPCDLCWYQRIFMYPLIAIISVGILRKDKGYVWYVLPLAVVGWAIALYHTLWYHGLITPIVSICRIGGSCTAKYLELFGFVSIPLMSFLAFSFVIVAMVGVFKLSRSDN